jgi:hypothetical protein
MKVVFIACFFILLLCCKKNDSINSATNNQSDTIFKYANITDNKYFVTYTLGNSATPTGYGFDKTISDFTNVSDGGYELTHYKDANTYTKNANYTSILYYPAQAMYIINISAFVKCEINSIYSTCFSFTFSFKELKAQTITFADDEQLSIADYTNSKNYYTKVNSTSNPGNLTLTITDVGSIGGVVRGTCSGVVRDFGTGADIPIIGSFSVHRGF